MAFCVFSRLCWLGLLSIFFLNFGNGFLHAEPVPLLLEEEASRVVEVDRQVAYWKLFSAENALGSGLPEIAITLATPLLEERLLSEEDRMSARLILIDSALVLGRWNTVEQYLQPATASTNERVILRRAFLALGRGDLSDATRLREGIIFNSLDLSEQAWVYLLDALLLARKEGAERSASLFTEAIQLAPNPALRLYFELIRWRSVFTISNADPVAINALRSTERTLRGERGGFEAARLLSIALFQDGDRDGAIQLLSAQLQIPGIRQSGLRPAFLLLLGYFAGPQSGRGRLALQELVGESTDVLLQEKGLLLLANFSLSQDSSVRVFLEDLNRWILRDPAHPLKDHFLAYRAVLHLNAGAYTAAEADARILVENFPGSPYYEEGLRMLAFLSWSREPPQYRIAADFLAQLRDRLPPGDGRFLAGRLMADSLFLNRDYSRAADVYGAILSESGRSTDGTLFFQRVLSEIRSQNLDAAEDLLDGAMNAGSFPDELIWEAQWNYLHALKSADQSKRALAQVRLLRRQDQNPSLSPGLDLRFAWIEARLLLDTGQLEVARERVLSLKKAIQQPPFSVLSDSLLQRVSAHLLLIEGESLFGLDRASEAQALFVELRQAYPNTGAAILSFLIEAREAAVMDSLVGAQQSLIQLADLFPESRYAPIALWEASLQAEQRGLLPQLQEAISILERLTTRYPKHELVFYARIRQGDLSRRLNDFGSALLLYEAVINQFPTHPERYRAELSRADCLFAMGSQDANRFADAIVVYERLNVLSRIPSDVRLEAGYKWAAALRQQGEATDAKSVLWMQYNQFLRNNFQLSEEATRGRYWLARSLLDLGSALEEGGDPREALEIYIRMEALEMPGSLIAETRKDRLLEAAQASSSTTTTP